MYKVKVSDARGTDRVYACGTVDQVLDRLDGLLGEEIATARVTDPSGKEWTASDFRRAYDP